MKKRVYIETSVISYLVARDSRDVVSLAKQQLTRDWWKNESQHYELFVSQWVVDEIKRGDSEASRLRMVVVEDMISLQLTRIIIDLAHALLRSKIIPSSAELDAFHVATAAVNEMDYLLTWNCKHINNARTLGRMAEVITQSGYNPPAISTPESLWR